MASGTGFSPRLRFRAIFCRGQPTGINRPGGQRPAEGIVTLIASLKDLYETIIETIVQERTQSMKAIVMNGVGGREMLEYAERPEPVAGPGHALVEIAFAGVNFMDIGVRQGMAWNAESQDPRRRRCRTRGGGGPRDRGPRARPTRRLGLCARELCGSRSRLRLPRWSRSPTRSTIEPRHP
jgi:hypothetical protein